MNSEEPFNPTPSRYRRWTPEDDQQLRDLFASGKPVEEIAAIIGRTRVAVTSRRLILHLDPPARKQHKRAAPWTASEVDLLKKMFHSGASQQDILKSLGRTPTKVRMKCRELRLLWFTIPWGDDGTGTVKRGRGRPRTRPEKA